MLLFNQSKKLSLSQNIGWGVEGWGGGGGDSGDNKKGPYLPIAFSLSMQAATGALLPFI